jgi:hypothetical protein
MASLLVIYRFKADWPPACRPSALLHGSTSYVVIYLSPSQIVLIPSKSTSRRRRFTAIATSPGAPQNSSTRALAGTTPRTNVDLVGHFTRGDNDHDVMDGSVIQ